MKKQHHRKKQIKRWMQLFETEKEKQLTDWLNHLADRLSTYKYLVRT